MTTLKYKEFQGAVSFEDGRLIVQLLHIDDFIAAECDCASEVVRTFESLVDEYLELCKAAGKDPCRPFKGSFNVRVAPDLHRKAAMAAASRSMSLNAWIEEALKDQLDRVIPKADLLAATLDQIYDQVQGIGVSVDYDEFGWKPSNLPPRAHDALKKSLLRH